MKKYQLLSTTIIVLLLSVTFPITASANSSWHWISHTNPLDVFPVIAIITLATETLLVKYFAKPENTKWAKLFCIIAVANLLSFLAPYVFEFNIWLSEELTGGLRQGIIGYPFFEWLMKGPFYTTGIVFLVMTLLVEVPLVFLALRKRVKSKKILLFTLISTNVLSTVIVAIAERCLCYGSW